MFETSRGAKTFVFIHIITLNKGEQSEIKMSPRVLDKGILQTRFPAPLSSILTHNFHSAIINLAGRSATSAHWKHCDAILDILQCF